MNSINARTLQKIPLERQTIANKVASSKVIEMKINWTKSRAPSSSTFKLLYDTKYMEVIQASYLAIRLTFNPRKAKGGKKREENKEKTDERKGDKSQGKVIPLGRRIILLFFFFRLMYIYMYNDSVSSTAWLFFILHTT